MTKEELLNKKTFIDLFSINSEIEQAEKEIELRQRASELKCLRDFNKLFNVWQKAMKKKISLGNEIKATDIPLQGLDAGNYVCNDKGIFKDSETICYHPIIPVAKYTNINTNKEKIKLAFRKNGKWQYFIADKQQISVASKIIFLSDIGIEVTSENAKGLVSYLSEIINKNVDVIPNYDSVSYIGWNKNDFIPYDKTSFFDGEDNYKIIYDSLNEKGDFNKWMGLVKELRKNKYIQIVMATTFASPLLEKMDIMPYIVNLWSAKSGTGKTVACMVAMSIWGNPASGHLHFSTNNTTNFYVRTASFLKNITMFCDELQIIKHSKEIQLDSLVMDLCNGKERGRATKENEIKEVKTWNNNFLFTNNDKLAKSNFGEQTFNRIIDIECNDILITHGNSVVNLIKNNYGFAGKIYINYIKEIGFERIRAMFSEYYKKIMENTKSTEKQAICIASIMIGNKLSQECLFQNEEELQVDDVKSFINDREEIETWRNAYEYLLSVVSINKKRFDELNGGEIWGKSTDFWFTISKPILDRELKKGGFEFDSLKRAWASNGILEKNSQGRYVRNTKVYGSKGLYVTINIKDI